MISGMGGRGGIVRRMLRAAYAPMAVLALWQAAAWLFDHPVVPGPVAALAELGRQVARGRILLDTLASSGRALAGMALAVAVGLPLGLVMGKSRRFGPVLRPLAYLLFPVPKIAFLPVFIVLLGLGNASKIGLLFVIVVFHIVLAVADGVGEIATDYYSALRVLGLKRPGIYRHLVLPASLPRLLSSMRLSAGTALSVLFFAENYSTRHGLGAFVMNAWIMADYPTMYAGIVALALLGVGMFQAIDLVQRRLCPWLGS